MGTADDELVGRTLGGRFRLTSLLGEGAMAAVYRAEQDAEPHHVAVKVMHTQLLVDPTFAKRFAREAKTAARIVHPNSVRILDFGVDGRSLYLAMELLEGQDLFDLIAKERRLSETRAAAMMVQVCDALTSAHAHGIIHRDLKPENVMILPDPSGNGADLVKVLDFGIAKILERDRESPESEPIESQPPSSALTQVGGLVGTPEYMSPEQAMGSPVDERSDVYSCGAVLFHAVTGRPPFVGEVPIEVLMQVPDKPPPAPTSIVPTIHPAMERIILRALAKAPAQRQQTAAELGDALRALLTKLKREGTPSSPSSPSTGRSRTPASWPTSLPGVPDKVVISTPPSERIALDAHDLLPDSSPGDAAPDTKRSPPADDVAMPPSRAAAHPLASTLASLVDPPPAPAPPSAPPGPPDSESAAQTARLAAPRDRRVLWALLVAFAFAALIWIARHLGLV